MINKNDTATKRYSTLNYRLSHHIKTKGLTIQEVAKKADISVGTMQKLVNDPFCNPTISSLESICFALNIAISDLIGEEERINNLNDNSVMLLEWDDLPITLEKIQNVSYKKELVKTSCLISNNAFALKMKDDSMLPLFPTGTTLIFDADKTPMNNSYILVHLHKFKNIIFKQLLIDKPFQYISALNPLFRNNLIKLESSDKIIAVLIQSQMQY